MSDKEKELLALVEGSIAILGDHVRPGGPSKQDTINALLALLDTPQVVQIIKDCHEA